MKRSKKTLLLLLTLAVMIGGYYAVTSITDANKESVTQTEASSPLSAVMADTLAAVEWAANGETYKITKADGVWKYDKDASFPMDQEAAQAIADRAAALTANRKLENVGSLADYGLESPTYTLTLGTADGATVVYAMGSATPFKDGYYVSVSGDKAIYTITGSLSSQFSDALTDLAAKEEIPALEDCTRISLVGASGILADQSRGENGKWHRTGTENAPEYADENAMNSWLDGVKAVSWNAICAWNTNDLSVYGLDEANAARLTAYSGDEVAWQMLLGGTDESGNVYAKLPDSSLIYTLTSAIAAAAQSSDDALRDMTVSGTAWDALASLNYDYDGTAHSLTVTRTEKASEETAEGGVTPEAIETATLDGAECNTQAAKSAYELLTALKGTGVAAATCNGMAVLTLTITDTAGAETLLVFRVHDVNTYQLDIGAERPLLVSADAVDKFVRSLKALGSLEL